MHFEDKKTRPRFLGRAGEAWGLFVGAANDGLKTLRINSFSIFALRYVT